MFNAKTVFILGAGASCHYGYPTGEELVSRVRKKASTTWTYFDEASMNLGAVTVRPDYVKRNNPDMPTNGTTGLREQMREAMNECKQLAQRLRYVEPLVIDYFIGQNRPLEDIAKLLIAWEIMECEATSENRASHNQVVDANWCRFVIHKLVTGCADGPALLQNKVTFVTFNYDNSLENQLWRGLTHLQQFEDVAEEFLGEDRILHVYGHIREQLEGQLPKIDWRLGGTKELETARNNQESQIWEHGKALLDTAFSASKGIKIISPDKAEMNPAIEKAKQAIAEAECVYILGYGFDNINNKLLDLANLLRANNNDWKYVLLTNYKNRGVVNKNASRLLFNGNANVLLEERGQVVSVMTFTCEKSIRTVYEALAYDFDAPEERPHS